MLNAIAYHQLTDAQTVPKQQLPPFQTTCPVLLFSMMTHNMGQSFGQSGSAVLVLSPSISLHTPSSLLAGQCEKRKSLTQCKYCSTTAKHLSAMNIILIQNQKHSIIPTIRKKIDYSGQNRGSFHRMPFNIQHLSLNINKSVSAGLVRVKNNISSSNVFSS